MKQIYIIFLSLFTGAAIAQCTSSYTWTASSVSASFTNQSVVSNAHYFWNFGDGTGSIAQNPTHDFPETGNYLVTLFAWDTLTNCSAYYETWLNVTKTTTNSCNANVNDSIFLFGGNWQLKVIDNSTNCSGYQRNIDAGPALNLPPGNWIGITSWKHARFVSRVQHYTTPYTVQREAYKTSPFAYTSAKNYSACSASFEFRVVSEDAGGQRILFTSMNKDATAKQWEIMGFGNPIYSSNDTISKYYPFTPNDLWLVGLTTTGQGGCKDTLYQNILVRKDPSVITSLVNKAVGSFIEIFPQPAGDKVTFVFHDYQETVLLSVFNVSGELLRKVELSGSGNCTIDRNELPAGLYYFVLSDHSRVLRRGKLVFSAP